MSHFAHFFLTSPNPSKGGENRTDVDLNSNLKSPLGGDLEGSNSKNKALTLSDYLS
jgi:hypothetical protein